MHRAVNWRHGVSLDQTLHDLNRYLSAGR